MRRVDLEIIAILAVICVCLLPLCSFAAVTSELDVAYGNWTNASSWNPTQVPTSNDLVNIGWDGGGYAGGTCIVDSAGCEADSLNVANKQSGYLILTNGANLSVGDFSVGIWDFDTGIWIYSNAYLNVEGLASLGKANSFCIDQQGGTINMNGYECRLSHWDDGFVTNIVGGGVMTNVGIFNIGYWGSGIVEIRGEGAVYCNNDINLCYRNDGTTSTSLLYQSGGVLDLNGNDITLARSTNVSKGTFHFSGGVAREIGNLYVGQGATNATEGVGVLRVTGSTGSIGINGLSFAGRAPKLCVAPDASGLTLVDVAGNVTIGDNCVLEIDLTNHVQENKTLVLVEYGGSRSGIFSATNGLPEDWFAEVDYDDSGKQIKLIITGPPIGTAIIIF